MLILVIDKRHSFCIGTPAGDSKKVEDYLKSPFDLAAFGPRLALGAVMSAQELSRNLWAIASLWNLACGVSHGQNLSQSHSLVKVVLRYT